MGIYSVYAINRFETYNSHAALASTAIIMMPGHFKRHLWPIWTNNSSYRMLFIIKASTAQYIFKFFFLTVHLWSLFGRGSGNPSSPPITVCQNQSSITVQAADSLWRLRPTVLSKGDGKYFVATPKDEDMKHTWGSHHVSTYRSVTWESCGFL